MRACAFSKMRGAAPMNVGLTTARFSTILSTRPSIAVANPHASWAVTRTLPNACAIGNHSNCRSSSPRMLQPGDRVPLVHPRRMRQPHSLGPSGGSRGVDQRRQLPRCDRIDSCPQPDGCSSRYLSPQLSQVGQGDHPVAVAGAVEQHHLGEVGQLGAAFGQLRQLPGVLGEHDSAFRVGQDVGGIACVGAGINGRGGGPGTHDRQIGQYPLVSRARRDTDSLLGLDAQRQQSGRQRLDAIRGLPPGRRDPFAGNKITESLLIRRRLDAVEKHRSHIRCGGRCGCEVCHQ